MSLTISQVRDWTLSGLTSTATGLSNGAATMAESALTVINKLQGIDTDWRGETRDAAEARAKDAASTLQGKAQRWTKAATVLNEAAQQMGLLRTAILDLVEDPAYRGVYVIAEDGNVELTAEYAATLTKATQGAAETARAALETSLRSLLATAELAGQLYDQNTTNALLGKDADSLYTPDYFPEPTALPTDPKTKANNDGSGPEQYNVDKPNWNGKLVLQRTQLLAEAGLEAMSPAWPTASKFLQHFLDGSGSPMTVPVDSMLHDMPWFNQAAQSQTRTALDTAIRAMPAGYRGPVAFQSDYTSQQPDGSPARPTNSSNPDWKNTLGTFSYQSSGIATPTAGGQYAVAARTSIYDYYNYETTDPNRYGLPQPSDLNMLHRAGWAQNFDTVGTSSTQTSTYP